MNVDPLASIPESAREACRSALETAFGPNAVSGLRSITGGASAAAVYQVDTRRGPYVLRTEIARSPMRNPHQYECMRIAAEAGIAPPLLHVDPVAGIAIMTRIAHRDLADHRGGAAGLARDLGTLIARLQETPTFPALVEYPGLVAHLFTLLNGSGAFARGLLEPHGELLERIRAAYPWDRDALVSSHNDPNPRNVLFDGEHLWLIDWETAYRNDPVIDVAILLDQLAPTPELADVLLHGWLGGAPDPALRARLDLARPLTRLYYACLLFTQAAANAGDSMEQDLSALTPPQLQLAIARGQLQPASTETIRALGKMFLAQFLAAADDPAFSDALSYLETR